MSAGAHGTAQAPAGTVGPADRDPQPATESQDRCTTGQVRVRVMPGIIWTRLTTI
jgi:hypothetical protein